MLSGCSCPRAIGCDTRWWALRGGVHGASLEPPPDADLPPAGFPETFTASVGSSRAKFFPLPTQPVFTGHTQRKPVSDSDRESGLDRVPASPEVIPTPPPLPPEDSKGQTGAMSSPIWIYDPDRWQSGGTSNKTLDTQSSETRTRPKGTSPQADETSWLFQSPSQSSSSAVTDHEPRVVLPNNSMARPASARRGTTLRR